MQVSKVDVSKRGPSTFADVKWPLHLSADSDGHSLVADMENNRILLLTSELCLERVLIDSNSQMRLRRPTHLSYNELTSELYVAHNYRLVSALSLR